MGKGGIYGKRKKQERPRSFKEESSEGGGNGSITSEARTRYGSYTVTQGYDTTLETVRRRRYERRRGRR